MHLKFRKFRHGGICNIVPGPRVLTVTEHPRLFPDLCGPDFLIQRVDHRERVPLVHLLRLYLKAFTRNKAHSPFSARPGWVRAPNDACWLGKDIFCNNPLE